MRKRAHPKKIGRYTIIGTIGRGGMGMVYRAAVPESGEVVALKLLHPAETMIDLLGMKKLYNIFTTEAKKLAALKHPHIVRVLELDSDNGTPYFTMEYHCNNLGMMIGEHFVLEKSTRVIPPDRVLDYGRQVLEGLRFIHAAGIIHRDIKPHNILLTDADSIKICDFGMALHEEDDAINGRGLKIGSPYYIAPEQNKDPEKADQRSDLYSVAVMLYRMLTGELPGMKSLLLSRINRLYDSHWDDFFIRALEWNPHSRFQSADEMSVALIGLELHLEKKKDTVCRSGWQTVHATGQTGRRQRSSPLRVSGGRAGKAFKVNELWQPVRYTTNIFIRKTKETVLDEATGLIWQIKDSGFPMDRDEAEDVIEALNGLRQYGISTWRLPTVNELLTLAQGPGMEESSCGNVPWDTDHYWYWSCDRRSNNTSWYVNTRLGYTGWQENGCRYSIRAVASLSNP